MLILNWSDICIGSVWLYAPWKSLCSGLIVVLAVHLALYIGSDLLHCRLNFSECFLILL